MNTEKPRQLRKLLTDAERLMWRLLRNRTIDGCKFRRQHPVGPYIVDFICIEKGLVIELDGGQHALAVEKDEKRTRFLNEQGYRVLRFWNNEVLNETEAVLTVILKELGAPHPGPLPGGERGNRRGGSRRITFNRKSNQVHEHDCPPLITHKATTHRTTSLLPPGEKDRMRGTS